LYMDVQAKAADSPVFAHAKTPNAKIRPAAY